MPRRSTVRAITTIGIDMGKNTLHIVGLDSLGAIILRERVSRGRITTTLANLSLRPHAPQQLRSIRSRRQRAAATLEPRRSRALGPS
jgi:hypothetical protein